MTKPEEVDVLHVLEIIKAGLKRASTIFCSQFPPEGWHSMSVKVQMAEAILGRMIHTKS